MAYGMTAAMRRYEREQDMAFAAEQWITDQSCRLMEDECNPDLPENFIESLTNARQDVLDELATLLKAGDATALGKFLFANAEDYWIQQSEQQAEDMLEERSWQ